MPESNIIEVVVKPDDVGRQLTHEQTKAGYIPTKTGQNEGMINQYTNPINPEDVDKRLANPFDEVHEIALKEQVERNTTALDFIRNTYPHAFETMQIDSDGNPCLISKYVDGRRMFFGQGGVMEVLNSRDAISAVDRLQKRLNNPKANLSESETNLRDTVLNRLRIDKPEDLPKIAAMVSLNKEKSPLSIKSLFVGGPLVNNNNIAIIGGRVISEHAEVFDTSPIVDSDIMHACREEQRVFKFLLKIHNQSIKDLGKQRPR
jgi:hypothetical protein